MITIGRCGASDVPDVIAFLDTYWKPGHIFVREPSLFEWQYAHPERPGEYSVVLARRDADRALVGMLGYIPTRRFDPALASANSVWLALWKVREDAAAGGLGLRLLTYLREHEPHVSVGVIGFQPHVAPIYTALKFDVGELHHYVLAHPDVSRFELASFSRPPQRPVPLSGLTAVRLDEGTFAAATESLDLGARAAQLPRKTAEYFRARYLRHPWYRYACFVLRREEQAVGLLATRLATAAGAAAIRIVDYLGPDDAVPGLGAVIVEQLRHTGAEYADIYNWGIDPALFAAAGFLRVDPTAGDVVPNHFEPLERRNAPVRFALESSRPAVLFKGDGDQDRPNEVPVQ